MSGKWKSIWQSKWLFLLPSLAGVFVFFVLPFVQTFVQSFSQGLHGYASVLGNEAFRLAVFNTCKFVGIAVPMLLLLSLLAALGIYKSKWMGLIKSAYLLPMAVPAAVVALVAKVIFDPSGIANQMLASVGGQGVGWLSSDAAFWTLVISYLWKNIGYTIVLWIAGIAAVPEHIMEAAKVDGASGGQCVFYILLPQLKPALYTITMLSFLNSFKVFREAYLLVGSYPPKSMYLLQHLFNNWYVNLDIDKMSAAAVMLAAAFALCSVLLQRMWEREERPGGIPLCPKGMDKKEKRPGGIPLCPKDVDKKEKRPGGIPLCPKDVDKKEERPGGIPLCPKGMDKKEENTSCG